MSRKKEISISELRQMMSQGEPVVLIDVRSPGEFASGHVPEAINIPLEQVSARLSDLPNKPVAILCQSGRRAGMACEVLSDRRDDLMIVEGGTQAWVKAGYGTVSTTGSRWSLERQVRLAAGILVLVGTGLSLFASQAWIGLAMFVGAGLTFAGLTNYCGMAMILAKLPWNKPAAKVQPVSEVKA